MLHNIKRGTKNTNDRNSKGIFFTRIHSKYFGGPIVWLSKVYRYIFKIS